jgi:hypothetical protein
VILAFASLPVGHAWPSDVSEIDGVVMPQAREAAGLSLRLNGIGLRTYSVFHVHIYVAGLYLEEPSRDAKEILQSDGAKLLVIRFVHDVTAAQARDAWASGFEDNCRAPCRLPGDGVAQFLAGVPDFHRGDESLLLFIGHTVQIGVNGRVLGTITDPDFTRTILATFIGAYPPTEPLKHGLLGLRD